MVFFLFTPFNLSHYLGGWQYTTTVVAVALFAVRYTLTELSHTVSLRSSNAGTGVW